jgi:hypothetical protein
MLRIHFNDVIIALAARSAAGERVWLGSRGTSV